MKSLNEDLKTKEFKQIYLLYGEEGYLKKQYKDKLTKAMISDEDTMNYAYFEGKGVNTKEIIDLAETMPFFGPCRLIVLENTGFFKNATPDLADYLKDIPTTTYFIFVEQELDKRGKLFKAVKEKGRIVELGKQEERTLHTWIKGKVKKEQKQISDVTIKTLLTKVGTDMENLDNELEKLFCYTIDSDNIRTEDVEVICTEQITNQIFEMVNAVADKKQKKALDYYYELLALKEPPMRILFLLARQFRLLLHVKELAKAGFSNKDIATKAGLHPFIVGKYLEQAKHFKTEELRGIIEACIDTEERVKTGRIGDSLSVELFIVNYSRAC